MPERPLTLTLTDAARGALGASDLRLREDLGVNEPEPTSRSWKDGIVRSYDLVAERYVAHRLASLERQPYEQEILDRYADAVRGQGQVCDVGCGPGVVAGYLHARGVDVFGIDLSSGMIDVARAQHPEIAFRQGDMLALDVPDSSLAGVVAFYSILHLPRPLVPRALGEIARVLHPAGDVLIAVCEGDGEVHDDVMLEQPVSVDTRFFRLGELEPLLEAAGLEVVATVSQAPAPLDYPMPRIYLRAVRPPGSSRDATPYQV